MMSLFFGLLVAGVLAVSISESDCPLPITATEKAEAEENAHVRVELLQTSLKNLQVPVEKRSIVLADGGSSGTKLFSFSADGSGVKDLKVETDCTKDAESQKSQGIAALSYSMASCQHEVKWEPNPKTAPKVYQFVAVETIPDVVTALLDKLETLHAGNCLQKPCPGAYNRLSVPLMATAGMRLLQDQDAIWDKLCGSPSSDWHYLFAERGTRCGTIPGTQEAYFEWVANAMSKKEAKNQGAPRDNTGMLGVGGASAQISIPLLTEADVKLFRVAIDEVHQVLGDSCSNVFIPGTQQPIPIFNHEKQCQKDFIDFTSRDALPEKIGNRLPGAQGLGLISFLGFGEGEDGRPMGIAGGVNAVSDWAKGVGCVSDDATFSSCNKILTDALSRDVLWKASSAFLHGLHTLDREANRIRDFRLNTLAAIPSNQFGSKEEEEAVFQQELQILEQGDMQQRLSVPAKLEEKLQAFCENRMGRTFGYDNNCMKALFVAKLVALLVDDNVQLYFKKIDWSNGAYRDEVFRSHSLVEVEDEEDVEDWVIGASFHFAELP